MVKCIMNATGSPPLRSGPKASTPERSATGRARCADKGLATRCSFLALWQRPALHACGFDTLIVGQEAEVYLPAYHCAGGAYANLRHMLRRAHRNGLRGRERPARVLKRSSARGAGRPAQTERMRLLVGLHGACDRALFAVVSTRCGEPVAYVEARPGFNGRGYGVDGMVRAPDAPAGRWSASTACLSTDERRRYVVQSRRRPPAGYDRSRPLLALICRGLRDGARQ